MELLNFNSIKNILEENRYRKFQLLKCEFHTYSGFNYVNCDFQATIIAHILNNSKENICFALKL